MASPFYTAEHEAYRDVVRRFVEKEIEPYAHEWDEAGGFPRQLYEKAAAIGLLGLGFPEQYGGTEVDNFMWIVAVQELARAGAGGVSASLKSNSIGAPPIARAGSPEFKARVLPQILSGKKISALAITEPSGGSDVANLRTSARRDGDCYVVNGEKTFITSGMRADYITTAVRTGGPGPGGVSLLVIEGDTPGLSRTPLKKMGFRHRDAAFRRLPVTPAGSMDSGPAPRGASRNDEDNDKMLFTSDHEEARRILQKFIAVKINPFVDEWEKAARVPMSHRSRPMAPSMAMITSHLRRLEG
jgi:alkylation response protein AidB-like acyl-CoA dehydrogenase